MTEEATTIETKAPPPPTTEEFAVQIWDEAVGHILEQRKRTGPGDPSNQNWPALVAEDGENKTEDGEPVVLKSPVGFLIGEHIYARSKKSLDRAARGARYIRWKVDESLGLTLTDKQWGHLRSLECIFRDCAPGRWAETVKQYENRNPDLSED